MKPLVTLIVLLLFGVFPLRSQQLSLEKELLGKCLFWDSRQKDSMVYYLDRLKDFQPAFFFQSSYGNYFQGRVAKDDFTKRKYFFEAASLASKMGDKYLHGLALFRVGRSYSRRERYDSAMTYYLIADSLFDLPNVASLVDPFRRRCSSYTSKTHISIKQSRYEDAIDYSLEAIKLAEAYGYDDLKLISLLNLGAAYGEYATSDIEEDRLRALSQRYLFEAAKLAVKLGDQRRAHLAFGNIGIGFEVEGSLDSAKHYLRKAIAIGKDTNSTLGLLNHYNAISLVFDREGQIDSAFHYISLAEMQADVVGQKRMQADIKLTKARLLLAIGEYSKAVTALQQANDIAKTVKANRVVASSFKMLYEIAEAQGKPSEALDFFEKHITYRDSVVSLENLNRIEELQTQYETQKKEQQILSLQQEAEIASLEISQQRFLTIALISLFGVLLAAGYVFFHNRRLKLIQQRLLVEQRLLRTQMNPHFLFNALSSVHTYMYEGDKRKAAEYLSMFSDLSRDVLNQSTEELISLEKELETLEKYVALQQTRYPWLDYRLDSGELELDIIEVPPMLLQPFVENAIEHGFKGKKEGSIELIIREEGEMLNIRLLDDGSGLTEHSGSKHKSKAIEIAQERLSLLLKKRQEYVLSVQNRNDGNGVEVTIKFPIITSV